VIFETLLAIYAIVGVSLLIFGLFGLIMLAGSHEDVSVAARFVVLSFVWPLVLVYLLWLFIRWVWKSADLF